MLLYTKIAINVNFGLIAILVYSNTYLTSFTIDGILVNIKYHGRTFVVAEISRQLWGPGNVARCAVGNCDRSLIHIII